MPRSESYDQSDALARHYSEMSDGELLELRADFDDLTDTAQNALRQELSHRKLWSNDATSVAPSEQHRSEVGPDDDLPDLGLSGTTICVCDSLEQAQLICFALGQQNIEAVTFRPEARYAQAQPQVRVASGDVEKANEYLAQGISDQIVQEFENQPAPDDFVEPSCPKCGAPDALLESVDPVNEWLCENCGNRWQDAPPEA